MHNGNPAANRTTKLGLQHCSRYVTVFFEDSTRVKVWCVPLPQVQVMKSYKKCDLNGPVLFCQKKNLQSGDDKRPREEAYAPRPPQPQQPAAPAAPNQMEHMGVTIIINR